MGSKAITKTQNQNRVRWLVRSDMDCVMKIEREAYGEYAWTRGEWRDYLACRSVVALAAEDIHDNVCGYAGYTLHKDKLVLDTIAVDARRQRQGVGESMIRLLKRKLTHQKRNRIELMVTETNLAAQLFFREMGFVCAEVVRRPYPGFEADRLKFVFRFDWEDFGNG